MDLHVGIFGLMRYGIVFIHNQPEQLALQLGVLTLFGASQEDLWTFGWDRPGSPLRTGNTASWSVSSNMHSLKWGQVS